MHIKDTVDTRGLSCPQPVMLVNQVIRNNNSGTIEVLADSATAMSNICRRVNNCGWTTTVEKLPDQCYRILLQK